LDKDIDLAINGEELKEAVDSGLKIGA